MRSVLFLISIIFFIPQFSSAYCDVGEVTAQSARSGTLGSDFGQSAITNCENKKRCSSVCHFRKCLAGESGCACY